MHLFHLSRFSRLNSVVWNCKEMKRTSLLSGNKWGLVRRRKDGNLLNTVLFLVVLCFLCLPVFVEGNDAQELLNMLSSLCSVNGQGSFASCCKSKPVDSVKISSKDTWDCYLYGIGYSSGRISSLFVSFCFCAFSSQFSLFSQEFLFQRSHQHRNKCLF